MFMTKFYSLFCAAAIALTANAQVDYTMGNWSINPSNGQNVSKIEKIVVTFNGLADGIDTHIIESNAPEYISITCGDDVYYPIKFQAGTVDIDQLVLTFNPITKGGEYTLNIKEGVVCDYDQKETHDEGEGYSVNPPITAQYTITETNMNVWNLDPADGSKLTHISDITIEFPKTGNYDGIDEYLNLEQNVTLTCGDVVYKPASSQILDDYISCRITFENITTPGKYVLHIPAGVFKEYDTYEDEFINPDIYAYYEITAPVSVDSLTEIAVTENAVYDLQGRRLDAGKSCDSLAPGLYIVNGKKIVIRK